MKFIEKIVFYLILGMLVLPAVQKELRIFDIPELKGDFVSPERPEFQWQDWQRGSFQEQYDEYIKDQSGFKDLLIRINNQIDWSFYKTIHADGVVAGKHDHLFEYDYIRAYMGRDFIGEELLERKVKRMKFIQKYLKEKHGINFIFVLEPGKATCHPEYIPEKYLENKLETTNYQTIVKLSQKVGLDYIDLNRWFPTLKPVTTYPLYAPYGTHWSIYGMSFAADTILGAIESRRKITLREVSVDSLILEDKARRPDYDMGAAMNLLFRLPEKEKLAYPVFRFGEKTDNTDFPMVLVVGDSYYWNIFNTHIPREVFANEAFWYFGKQVYPDTYYSPKFVEDLNLQEEVEKQDVIFLMTTERFLYKFDWHFVDNVYRLYAPTSEYDKILDYMNSILIVDEWFEKIIEKAERQNITVAEMLKIDSKYIYSIQDPEKYYVFYGVSDIEENIKKDINWLRDVKQKAKEQNLSLETMIRKDAEFVLSQEHPEAYKKYLELEVNKQYIKNDSMLLRKTRKEADYYMVSFETMLQINAEKLNRNNSENKD